MLHQLGRLEGANLLGPSGHCLLEGLARTNVHAERSLSEGIKDGGALGRQQPRPVRRPVGRRRRGCLRGFLHEAAAPRDDARVVARHLVVVVGRRRARRRAAWPRRRRPLVITDPSERDEVDPAHEAALLDDAGPRRAYQPLLHKVHHDDRPRGQVADLLPIVVVRGAAEFGTGRVDDLEGPRLRDLRRDKMVDGTRIGTRAPRRQILASINLRREDAPPIRVVGRRRRGARSRARVPRLRLPPSRSRRFVRALKGGLGDLELLARRELVGDRFGREDDFRGIRNGRGRLA